MVARRLRLSPADVVFVKGIIEASDGVAALFAEPRRRRHPSAHTPVRGELLLAAPVERTRELLDLIADLRSELGAEVELFDAAAEPRSAETCGAVCVGNEEGS
jgi:hypothetical protein